MTSKCQELMDKNYLSSSALPLLPPPIMNSCEFSIPMEDPNYPKSVGDPNYPQVVFYTIMGEITFKVLYISFKPKLYNY